MRGELDGLTRELDRARREVRAALDRFQQVRSELDRLQGAGDARFAEADRLAHVAETYFPEYQVRTFSREVDDGATMFGMLQRREQYAQLKIWIGRLRRFQEAGPPDEERELLDQVFRRLVGLSKQYAPDISKLLIETSAPTGTCSSPRRRRPCATPARRPAVAATRSSHGRSAGPRPGAAPERPPRRRGRRCPGSRPCC